MQIPVGTHISMRLQHKTGRAVAIAAIGKLPHNHCLEHNESTSAADCNKGLKSSSQNG
jgi:hypothetical protein